MTSETTTAEVAPLSWCIRPQLQHSLAARHLSAAATDAINGYGKGSTGGPLPSGRSRAGLATSS